MVPWWTLVIPVLLFVIFWALHSRASYERDQLIRTVQQVEMEYRLMSQNVALFNYIQDQFESLPREERV